MAKIFIGRPSEIFNVKNAYRIYIDEKEVGAIGNAESSYFEVENGEHTVAAKMNSFMGSAQVLLTVNGDEVKSLKVTGKSGVLWLAGVAAIDMLLIAMQDVLELRYLYLICPGIFLLYFLTIGRKNHLSLTLDGQE